MATPTMITISGTVETPPGTPVSGRTVTLEQQINLTHADGTLIEPTEYTGVANEAGVVSFQVPATTDPAWSPQGWTYRVSIGDQPPFRAGVPHNAVGGTITLGQLIPVSASGGSIYSPINHSHADLVSDAELADGVQDLLDDGFAVGDRFSISAAGGMDWGPPGGPKDTNLYRGDSGLLFTDNNFQAEGIRAGSSLRVGGVEVSQLITNALQAERQVTGGEFVVRRRDANSYATLVSERLYATHFVAGSTRRVMNIRTVAGVAATGTTNGWVGMLRWDPGVGYTPIAISVDDPTRWASAQAYQTPVFGVTGGGSANLSDPGFDLVAGVAYAMTVQWVGSGTQPQLRACLVEPDSAFTEPRENGYMGLLAPPSSVLQPGWLTGSHAQFQGLLLS